jgi:aminopeptidase N
MEKLRSIFTLFPSSYLYSSSRIFILYSLFFLISPLASFSQTLSLDWIDQDASLRAQSLKKVYSTSSIPEYRDLRFAPTSSTIDVKFHRILLTLDPAVRYVTGSVSTYFVPTTNDLQEITFDLSDSLDVTAVKYHGKLISSFNHQNNRLTISLPTGPKSPPPPSSFLPSPSSSVLDSIMVDYQGVPPDNGSDSFNTGEHAGVPVLYTLSEPYGAKDWWPCKQDLNDKIDSVMLVITVPKGYRAASNGILHRPLVECPCEDKDVFIWKHNHPIAAYLIGVAVTNYAVYSDYVRLDNIGRADSIEILNYVYPETLTQTKSQTTRLTKPFQLFNQLFGLYPYADERYGHAQWNWGGGMEHQTMTFIGDFNYELMAHELAHQWFGDFITCGSWRDIWLNEGFATYLAGLCYERDQDGIYWEPFKRLNIARVIREPGGSVYCYDTTDVDRIFDSRLSYSKGAMVLHMLRWEMGDENFFTAMNNYLYDPDHANGYARTEDLIAHCEAVADTSFTEFFNDWVYGEGYPKYSLQFRRGEGTGLLVQVNQEPSIPGTGFFEMHIQIRAYGREGFGCEGVSVSVQSPATGYVDFKLHHIYNGQIFRIDPGFVVDSVQFDPERWICTANPTIMNVDEIPLDQQIRVYPNPVTDRMMIECPVPTGEIRVCLYDANGRNVSEKRYPSTSGLIEISVADLPEGVYVVKVETGSTEVVRRVVVL